MLEYNYFTEKKALTYCTDSIHSTFSWPHFEQERHQAAFNNKKITINNRVNYFTKKSANYYPNSMHSMYSLVLGHSLTGFTQEITVCFFREKTYS